jgi:hypothetical protein
MPEPLPHCADPKVIDVVVPVVVLIFAGMLGLLFLGWL